MLPAFSFQDVIWTVSRRCAIQEKEHRDGLCAFIPPRVPRPILHNHVAALQPQGLAVVKLEPNLSIVDNRVVDSVCRSEEHTSELQSRQYLVCRLLLEKKKKKQ